MCGCQKGTLSFPLARHYPAVCRLCGDAYSVNHRLCVWGNVSFPLRGCDDSDEEGSANLTGTALALAGPLCSAGCPIIFYPSLTGCTGLPAALRLPHPPPPVTHAGEPRGPPDMHAESQNIMRSYALHGALEQSYQNLQRATFGSSFSSLVFFVQECLSGTGYRDKGRAADGPPLQAGSSHASLAEADLVRVALAEQ
ncbi:hypothetical protein E1301_Tti019904 [Triplophysa tibetana]|uniref:Uncharacterized protein n=1 Tax=Triplophysa tibetana TaxID=1572043 RepID=A0A5A9PDD7_9TELE|nr:hypothetical protein E1301_Tti019904 [Triplophysa tibetana]